MQLSPEVKQVALFGRCVELCPTCRAYKITQPIFRTFGALQTKEGLGTIQPGLEKVKIEFVLKMHSILDFFKKKKTTTTTTY